MGSLDNFQHQKIIVVGDVMLDRYWWGNVDRISPEAPVPVVHISSSTCAAGGAANVAANITGLGATSILFGVVGNDLESDELSDAMGSAGVSSEFLVRSDSRTTIVKTRVVAHGQHVVRVDRETVAPLSQTEEAIVLQKLIPLISEANAVLISDYNKGLLTPGVLSAVIKEAKDKEILYSSTRKVWITVDMPDNATYPKAAKQSKHVRLMRPCLT